MNKIILKLGLATMMLGLTIAGYGQNWSLTGNSLLGT